MVCYLKSHKSKSCLCDAYKQQICKRCQVIYKIILSRTDVTAEVLEKQDAIPAKLSEIEKMLQDDIPDIDIGKHCFEPHGCDFYSHCWSHIPKKNSVFDISYAMVNSGNFTMMAS